MSRNQELDSIKAIFRALDKLKSYDSKRRVLDFVNAQPLDVEEAEEEEPVANGVAPVEHDEPTDSPFTSTAGQRFA